jgi:hypothetical protein
MPKGLSASELAQSYGWALSMLKSDKSLWRLFNRATKGQWTPDKFVAELKSTGWWKKNSESVRQYKFLKSTDPATLNARRSALRSQVNDAAAAMGAVTSWAQISKISENALMFNWNDSQLRDAIASYTRAVNGVYRGQAGNDVDDLRQVAWRNGVKLSGPTLQTWVQNIAKGSATVDYYKQQVRRSAKTLAPGYAQELDSGMDLYDIANAYIQSKAKLLEMNPADIDLFDSDVRGALSSKDKAGKPTTKSLWEFEQQMRRKPQWLRTQQAQDEVMSVGRQVLRDFGFSGA